MKTNCNFLVILALLAVLAGCQAPTSTPPTPIATPAPGIANPASENCLTQGGTLSIQERGDGSQYGICLFEDNRQCEEWR
jgi:putative hemolysin